MVQRELREQAGTEAAPTAKVETKKRETDDFQTLMNLTRTSPAKLANLSQ